MILPFNLSSGELKSFIDLSSALGERLARLQSEHLFSYTTEKPLGLNPSFPCPLETHSKY